MSSQHIGQKTNEYLNSAEQIPRNWNVDQLSVLITSWDITEWCSINLLWKELMERMSEHTGLISSYQLLITAACTNTGRKMKGSHSRAADRCPFVLGHSLSQVTSVMQLGMLCWFFFVEKSAITFGEGCMLGHSVPTWMPCRHDMNFMLICVLVHDCNYLPCVCGI